MDDNKINQISAVIEKVLEGARLAIPKANNLNELHDVTVIYLGKNGSITKLVNELRELPKEIKPIVGKIVNQAKQEIDRLVQEQKDYLTSALVASELNKSFIDITLPGRGMEVGSIHPINKVKERLEKLFISMGFIILDDTKFNKEIEDEFHNFDALNIPKSHPARSASDTFYLENNLGLLRTQTSPVQIRALETFGAPLRVIASGRVYRRDFDVTHTPMFHQLEGLLISENASFAELKGWIYDFLENFFEQKVDLRFRPSYFPFTEPSAEVDLKCIICDGKGCRVCKGGGWIEVFGCGMVHPNVLKSAKVDPEKYSGFAFGLGIDRLTMFRYGIGDLRMLFENDISFLEQF